MDSDKPINLTSNQTKLDDTKLEVEEEKSDTCPDSQQPSATNDNQPEDDQDSAIDDDEDDICTMSDVLKEQEEMELDAMAVLGSTDDKNCTYQMEYVQRQPLYACKTCPMKVDPETKEKYLAGICLACSFHCHEGHEILELYTKRNFCCDCGNNKFEDSSCKLYEKSGFNEKNVYNHNFAGLYCTCKRPFPDPDNDIPDVMLQCVVCEDWFHARHLDGEKPSLFSEVACTQCVKKYNFLQYYVDGGSFSDESELTDETVSSESGVVKTVTLIPFKVTFAKATPNSCKLAALKEKYAATYGTETVDVAKCKSLYLPKNWRLALCNCSSCSQMYSELNIEFLVSESDTIAFYEEMNEKNNSRPTNDEKALSELNKLGHVQQIEYIRAYNEMKGRLKQYLSKFAAEKRVVREEDIVEFFEQMNERKRKRTSSNVPYFCR